MEKIVPIDRSYSNNRTYIGPNTHYSRLKIGKKNFSFFSQTGDRTHDLERDSDARYR